MAFNLLNMFGAGQGGNMLSQPQQAVQQPSIWDRYQNFTQSNRGQALGDFFTGLAMGATPQQSLASGAKLVAAGRADRRGQDKSQEQRNQTVQWLQSQGIDPQEAGLIANDPKVLADFLKQQFAPKADDRTSAIKEYQFAKQQGFGGSFADWEQQNRGGTTINMPGQPTIGTIPQGYAAYKDPVTGKYSMEPVAGGPAAQAAEQAQQASQTADQNKAQYGNVVLEDLGRFKKVVENAPWYSPAAGFGATYLSSVGGTPAANAAALSKTVKANIGFDRLQKMREESPTGGALGQVTERELSTLQAVLGNLEQSQGEEQLLYNIDRLNTIYRGILEKASAYPNAAKYGFGGSQAHSQAAPDPLGIR